MHERTFLVAAAVWLVVAALAIGTGEQGTSAASEPTAVRLGEGSATPDAQVVVPVSLSAEEVVGVGAIEVRVTFEKALLSFVKIDPSGLATAVNAKVAAQVKPGPTEGSSVVTATISTTGEDGSRQPIPTGPVAYLAFRIAATTSPDTTIPLIQQATVSTTDNPPKLIAPVVSDNGRIIVAAPPVPACLFYMH